MPKVPFEGFREPERFAPAWLSEFKGVVERMKHITLEVADARDGKADCYPNIYTAIPTNKAVCGYTGLKHATLYKLLTGDGRFRPFVRTVHVREPGSSRGKTLFHVGDFLRHLDTLAVEQGTGRGAKNDDDFAGTAGRSQFPS